MSALRWLRREAARHESLTVGAAVAVSACFGFNLDAVIAAIRAVL